MHFLAWLHMRAYWQILIKRILPIDVVEALVGGGARPCAKNAHGKNVAQVAADYDKNDVVALLERYIAATPFALALARLIVAQTSDVSLERLSHPIAYTIVSAANLLADRYVALWG